MYNPIYILSNHNRQDMNLMYNPIYILTNHNRQDINLMYNPIYSQTCLRQSFMGNVKSDLSREVTS